MIVITDYDCASPVITLLSLLFTTVLGCIHTYIYLPIIVREKYFYTFHKYYHGQVLAAVVRTFDIELPIIVREKFLHQSHAALTDVVHAHAVVVGGVQAAT